MKLTNLFGCIDDLTLGGQKFDLGKAGLPECPSCFMLNTKATHVLPSIQDLIQPAKGRVLPLNRKSRSIINGKMGNKGHQ